MFAKVQLNASLTDSVAPLPASGIDKKTAQAMHAVGKRANWWMKDIKADTSGISVQEKINKIVTAHESLQHLGGREGVIKVLREAEQTWHNMELDAAFVLRRCDFCLANSTRGVNVPDVRRLPRPLASGEILGVDLKKVTPSSSEPWTMLLLLDFASNRLWAHALDDDATLGTALITY